MKRSLLQPPGAHASLPAVLLLTAVGLFPRTGRAQNTLEPGYLRDRGPGVASSLTGIYIRKGELLIHPFFEYVRDDNREYQPREFGLGPDVDFRGRSRRRAGQLFVGYGVTDWLALEFEGAYLRETLSKSARDTFPTPAKIAESGITDLEAQIRLRPLRETARRPEVYAFLEITARAQRNKLLIGDPDWDLRPGLGLTRGFSWGTLTARATGEYNRAGKNLDFGEVALGYLKRLDSAWRVYLGVEGGEGGAMDEWELTPGVQWSPLPTLLVRLESPLGLSSKAADWSPQFGFVFTLPPKHSQAASAGDELPGTLTTTRSRHVQAFRLHAGWASCPARDGLPRRASACSLCGAARCRITPGQAT
jgi:hypothetical protein